MKQPKYKMGEEINILIPMCHEGAEMHIMHKTTGIICGISYDPNDLSSNAPYYDYKVRPKKANNSLYFGENKIRKWQQEQEPTNEHD